MKTIPFCLIDLSLFSKNFYDRSDILQEIELLSQEVELILLQHNLHLIELERLCCALNLQHDESQVIDLIVDYWLKVRQNGLAQLTIDDLYQQIEYLWLWQLLNQLVREQFNNSNQLVLSKIRKIIRRYSKMPKLWQYICLISGEQVSVSYTF
ncbi:MAG: hypothetical protein RLZZ293_571 [Pseudomonadota bacterium]|jgi:hypothetical protein